MGPVLRLARLGDDELLALIVRMTALHAQYYGITERISGEDQLEFMRICMRRAGADMMITPREMLRDYMTVLNILMQNPDLGFADIARGLEGGGEAGGAEGARAYADGALPVGKGKIPAYDAENGAAFGGGVVREHAVFDPNDIDF